jgi:enamine deaminase RidA (YjgF/YER057c/UK114 family)
VSAHQIVTAPQLAPPAGYAHAVVAAPGRIVHLGGQTAIDAEGRITVRGIVEQFDVAAGNVVAALAAAGGTPQDVVSMQVFVTDLREYRFRLPELAPVWRAHFGEHYPAMGLFGVSALFEDDAQVELMAVAVLAGR